MIDIHSNHTDPQIYTLFWPGMIGIRRRPALDLQLIDLPILEDQIQTIAHLPGTVEALFKDLTIESTILLNPRMI